MLLRFVFNNIKAKPLRNILVVISTTVSIILMLMMVNVASQVENQYDNSYEYYNIVVGATGSKTELVLDSVFFSGVPENVLSYEYYEMLEERTGYDLAPIAMGDNISGHYIVGTNAAYLSRFDLSSGDGLGDYASHIDDDGNILPVAVVGAKAAKNLGLTLGNEFAGSHQESIEGSEMTDDAHHHEEYAYTVIGILKETGNAVDNAVFTHIESVWAVHESHEEESDEHEHEEGRLTAILVAAGGSLYTALLNDEVLASDPNVMVVSIGDTLGSVQNLFGSAGGIVLAVVIIVVIISFNMLFLAMFTSASERKRDVSVLRALGCNRNKILATILLEALIIIMCSCILGLLLSFAGMAIIGGVFTDMMGVNIVATSLCIGELYIILGAVAVALLATLIPALMVYNTEPSKYLR